jgi:hypothetical protein
MKYACFLDENKKIRDTFKVSRIFLLCNHAE